MNRDLRLVILEDNADDIELLLWTLRDAGFQVTADVASNRQEFLDLVRAHRYDVVLSDYRMPHVTGYELYQAMRAEGFQIPFILVTGALPNEAEKGAEFLEQGIAECILKDRLEGLPQAVQRAIEARHRNRP